MSENYIRTHFDDIKKYANVIENRLNDSDCTMQTVINNNNLVLEKAKKYNVNYILIENKYEVEMW